MSKVSSGSVRHAFLEAFFVVLGVVLALAANHWNEGRQNRGRADRALASIMDEIRSNTEAVEASEAYHAGLITALFSDHDPGWVPEARMFDQGFVFPARVYRTAWESAGGTGLLNHMDYETVLQLSKIYAQQDRYEVQARSVSQIIYGALFSEGIEAITRNYRNLASVISAFQYRERQLGQLYQETLATLAIEASTTY